MNRLKDTLNTFEISNNIVKSNVGDTEKIDSTPEKIEKTDIVPVFDANFENNNMQSVDNKNLSKSSFYPETSSNKNQEDEAIKKTLAFTIDFGSGKDVNTQRHRTILERFEQRHRRGQSLCKLEENFENGTTSPVTSSKPPLSGKLPRKRIVNSPSESSFSSEQDDIKARIRLRDKSSLVLDASKRHSWSPRSSLHENMLRKLSQNTHSNKQSPNTDIISGPEESITIHCHSLDSTCNSLDSLPCVEPPLESFPQDDEAISEAGTYTLDGDNYTEEQKEKMNIDKLGAKIEQTPTVNAAGLIRPTHFKEKLNMIELEQPTLKSQKNSSKVLLPIKREKNILEVHYTHGTSTSDQSRMSYLDKLKSRVKSISDKALQKSNKMPEQILNSPDLGCFTSVTTSGILSVKSTLEDNLEISNKNSLTKATIESSEYVKGLTRVNPSAEKEKLTRYDGKQFKLTTHRSVLESTSTNPTTSSESPKTSTDDESITDKSMQVLKTASNKKDWIQEWARNAREYSSKKSNKLLTQSYDSEQSLQNEFQQYESNKSSDFEYSSDPHLRYKEYLNIRKQQLNHEQEKFIIDNIGASQSKSNTSLLYGSDDEQNLHFRVSRKPPMSPSKIPSPIHTLSRPRSVSMSRKSEHGSKTVSINILKLSLKSLPIAYQIYFIYFCIRI